MALKSELSNQRCAYTMLHSIKCHTKKIVSLTIYDLPKRNNQNEVTNEY